jgi:hypothetical protein
LYIPLSYVILGNIGKLNYYLGKRASDERDEGRFPNIDFCSSPEAICANDQGEESNEDIKWIVGFFEWIERIQSYKDWDYLINLQIFVDGGSWDDSFIDAVSSIITQGCHSSYCSSTMEVTKLKERREKFVTLLDILKYSEPMLPTNQPSSIYAWKGVPAPTWVGNEFPTTIKQQGNVQSNGNSPSQFASNPNGNDAGTSSLPISSDSTNTTEATSSKGIGTTNKDILIPIEDSSALPMSLTAFWMKSVVIGFLNSIVWM